jgi:hypothetical protein
VTAVRLQLGTTRAVLLVGPFAFKFPRLTVASGRARGRACNRWEAETWRTWSLRFDGWRNVLAPVLWADRWGWLVVMSRTESVSEEVLEAVAWAQDSYPEPPCEFKAEDWGRLPDGRIVAHDYAQPALAAEAEAERREYLSKLVR